MYGRMLNPILLGSTSACPGPSQLHHPTSGDRDVGSIWGLLCVICKSPSGTLP